MSRMLAMGGASLIAMTVSVGAHAQATIRFHIVPQALAPALRDFALQSRMTIVADDAVTRGKVSVGYSAVSDPEAAMHELLRGTGLTARRQGKIFFIGNDQVSAGDPGTQLPGGTPGTNDIIVTARKRAESIQDVPIAITAIKQVDLTTRQVTGGPDLITQVPNMTFTKTNFSSYSIQIRGIGTQAISATTDPAVGVAFNNTPFIRNRFFEQEFYDLDRVEVLRGPQGTLYGRNATAGVVNLISAKPVFHPDAKLSFDYGSYSQKRGEAMVNVPLITDKLALRVAGAFTIRDGYDHNSIDDKPIDGRNLFSTRTSLRFKPTDRLEANLIWEHFQENDDRLRSGKQLCDTDEKTSVAGMPVTHYQILPDSSGAVQYFTGVQATFSQGCKPESFYSKDSFGTPEGLMLPYYAPLGVIGLPVALGDPYVSRSQSTDLRTIESTVKPIYKARSNIYELQMGWDVADRLKLTSETGYNKDYIFSEEDFNRFNTARGAFRYSSNDRGGVLTPQDYYVTPVSVNGPDPGMAKIQTGIFCDNQIGCTDRLVGVDLSTARSTQFSQELRLSSSNKGPFNFSVGANYLYYKTIEKYYVFFNSLSLIAAAKVPTVGGNGDYIPGVTDNRSCLPNGQQPPNPRTGYPVATCVFIDTNPIDKLNDKGHNYFLSDNPYKLNSYSIFGEAYYSITNKLRLTAGARLSRDDKRAPQIPSWVLASNTVGYPVASVIKQHWTEPTGKLSLDWKPDLSFTDSTLLYASAARGYKAGGANPPPAGLVYFGAAGGFANSFSGQSAVHPTTFKPEFINAFEIGAKNELFDRTLTANLAAFYYDYHGYQISQIVDRSASNLNFDATIWGAEFESAWSPTRNLQLGLKLGYEHTRLADGSKAIDLMDRTAGNPDWTLRRPFPTNPSSCILPTDLVNGVDPQTGQPILVNLGTQGGGGLGGCELAYEFGHDPVTDLPYVPNPTVNGPNGTLQFHPGYKGFDPATAPNHGEGFYKDLSGKELPNAPHFTASVTADYSLPLIGNWIGTLHGDFYYQAKEWARIFNTPGYDRIRGYSNVNFALLFNNKPAGWSIMAYVKNAFDTTAITGAFLNSDDTGLTTNIFLTEPRRYGIRITKDFSGLPLGLGSPEEPHQPGVPYAVTIEGGLDLVRQMGKVQPYRPTFGNAFPSNLDIFSPLQRDRHFGRKDATDIALTIQPDDSPWKASARVRYGRVEKGHNGRATSVEGPFCAAPAGYRQYCSPQVDPVSYELYHTSITSYDDVSEQDRERHLLVDFEITRDIGLGSRLHSSAGLGVRFGDLRSDSDFDISGIPDDVQPIEFLEDGINPFHRYQSNARVRRNFRGAGPILKWNGGWDIVKSQSAGVFGLDGSVTGGVLFGHRRFRVTDNEITYSYTNDGLNFFQRKGLLEYYSSTIAPTSVTPKPVSITRDHAASVPTLGGSAGVSYSLGRVAVKAGYSWERYFNAIDGGNASGAKSYDRTIQGPYIKLSLGLGR